MEFMDFAEREDEHPIQAGEHGHEETGTRGENANAVKPSGKRKREKRTKVADTPTAQQPKSRHLAGLTLLKPDEKLQIRSLSGCQIRNKSYDPATTGQYAERLSISEPPNIIVISENGRLFIADGHNRVAAATLAGRTTVVADVYAGTKADARIVGAEMNQGSLPMTPAERKAMLDELLDNPNLNYTSAQIAAIVGMSRGTVDNRKKEREEGDFLSIVNKTKRPKSAEEKLHDAAKSIAKLFEKHGVDVLSAAWSSLPVNLREDIISFIDSKKDS